MMVEWTVILSGESSIQYFIMDNSLWYDKNDVDRKLMRVFR